MTNLNAIQKDIEYCIDFLDLSDTQIGEILRCCERLGNISVEYFCEEFIFEGNSEEVERWHDDSYLNIAQFNALYYNFNQED